ncbi:MAG: NADPH-dependent 7-cyano-7-deazaguanine reductase QueF, partial [Arenimonas sp.]
MTDLHDSALGKAVAYPSAYDPALLHPIARSHARAALGVGDELPFTGVDVWNAYELGWLDARGKPKVALAEFRVPAASPNLVESKSLKLYLASHHQVRYADTETLRALLAHDLSAAAGAAVSAVITPV